MYIAKEKGILGDYYDQRLELIDYYHDLSRRIARMRLLGEASWGKEDYELIYGLRAGLIQMPTGPLYLPESYQLDNQANDSQIRRGLFNVRRWISGIEGKSLRGHQDPFPQMPDVKVGSAAFAGKGTVDPTWTGAERAVDGAMSDVIARGPSNWNR